MSKKNQKTKIQWADYTWNPVWGCYNTCEYCYARTWAVRFAGPMANYEALHMQRTHKKEIDKAQLIADLSSFKPTVLQRGMDKEFVNTPSRVFVNSMSDTHFWGKETMSKVIARIKQFPKVIFMFLTKYPESYNGIEFPDNVWLGVSVTNNKDLEKLDRLKVNNLSFVSMEPLFEEVSIAKYLHKINWVIVGGQTGKDAKIMQESWVNRIRLECETANTPFFFKSWGAWVPETQIKHLTLKEKLDGTLKFHTTPGGWRYFRVGSKNSGNLIDGQKHVNLPIYEKQ